MSGIRVDLVCGVSELGGGGVGSQIGNYCGYWYLEERDSCCGSGRNQVFFTFQRLK